MQEKHNGFTNFETWLFDLWYFDYYLDYIQNNDVYTTEELAEIMKEQIIDLQEETDTEVGMFNDAISNMISQINFYEVAKSITDEVKD
jgi:hypothetical protein